MRDVASFVREHVEPLRLPDDRKIKVVEELTAQLEEIYESQLRSGVAEEDAWVEVERQVPSWEDLERDLLRAEPRRRAAVQPSASSSGGLLGHLRYTIRVLARTPGFTATVIGTLALGIGANLAVFVAVDAILLQPLPFPDGDRLVRVSEVRDGVGATNVAPPRLEDWSRMSSTFEAISGYFTDNVVDTTGELPERLRRAVVAPRFLEVWGVSPELGRGFAADEHSIGGPAATMISDRIWRNRGADPSIIDQTIRSGGQSATVIGIMPAAVRFPERDVDVWAAFPLDAPFVQSRQPAWLAGIGRLKPGVSIAQAQADLTLVQAQLAEQYPDTDRGIGVHVEPLKDNLVGSARLSLWFLFGAVSLLLLIACTNIAALLLSRATVREYEIAVRYSLGASFAAVVRQMLTETAVLVLAGTVLGLLLATGASKVFRVLAPDLPRVDEIAIDARMFLYAVAVAVIVTVLCGVLPAVRNARCNPTPGRAVRAPMSPRHSLQWVLVGVQVALSVTLLAGSGLLVRSIAALSRVDAGFDSARVLTFNVTGRFGEAGGYDGVVQRINDTLDELVVLPGIEAAATASMLPGVPAEQQRTFELVEARAPTDASLIAENRVVSPSYFETMRIPLVAGELCPRPTSATGERQVMVNQTFADRYFAGGSVVGLHLDGPSAGRIAGIVADARERGVHRESFPTVYGCFSAPDAAPWFLVRTDGEPLAAAHAIRSRIKELEPLRPVYDIGALDARIAEGYAQDRLRTLLLAFFAIAALALACVGIYGTLSYVVGVRSREVGLRMALGASARSILAQFLLRALRVAGLACAAGILLSFALTRWLSSMLYGVSPADPLTLSGVVAIVLSAALLAAGLPAMRAANINPLEALRES